MHTTDSIMEKFGEQKALLAREGVMVEAADVLIAATALVYDATQASSQDLAQPDRLGA